jgi:acetyltransferase
MAHDSFGDAAALHAIFHPTTVAVIGLTAEPDTLGHTVLAGLKSGGFERSLIAIDVRQPSNPFGVRVYRELEDVPAPVDLAVVVTTPDETLAAIEKCIRAGVKGVVVLSGVERIAERRREFERHVREQLRRSGMKLIGPGCCALMNPSLGLNVSPGLPMPVAGNVAFIAQSGSLATTIIDWSHKGIVGFSAFVSLGEMVDVGWETSSIILAPSRRRARFSLRRNRSSTCAHSVRGARRRAAEADYRHQGWPHRSRRQRILVAPQLPRQRRRGVRRGASTRRGDPRGQHEELFHVADALSKQPRPKGPRLTIVTNAGGPGVLAADHVVNAGTLVPQTDEPSDMPSDPRLRVQMRSHSTCWAMGAANRFSRP